MHGRLRAIFCCGLAMLNVSLSIGNPTGFVLCVGEDGSMAIESPSAQAACLACRQRHESTSAEAPMRPGIHFARAGGCIDVPLSLAPGAVLHRSHVVGRVVSECVHCSRAFIADAPLGSACSSDGPQPGVEGRPPPSFALTALTTIVLLI
jgi:hypothetical protein